jgi:hypothetical protein
MTVNKYLHDADLAVMGARMARRMGDVKAARKLDLEAKQLYWAALELDVKLTDPAWSEDGNRDEGWLVAHGLRNIPMRLARKAAR